MSLFCCRNRISDPYKPVHELFLRAERGEILDKRVLQKTYAHLFKIKRELKESPALSNRSLAPLQTAEQEILAAMSWNNLSLLNQKLLITYPQQEDELQQIREELSDLYQKLGRIPSSMQKKLKERMRDVSQRLITRNEPPEEVTPIDLGFNPGKLGTLLTLFYCLSLAHGTAIAPHRPDVISRMCALRTTHLQQNACHWTDDEPKKTLVASLSGFGYGDASASLKLYSSLSRAFPQHSFDLAIHENEGVKFSTLKEELVTDMYHFSSYAKQIANAPYDLIVDYPLNQLGSGDIQDTEALVVSRRAHLSVTEYGYDDSVHEGRKVLDKYQNKITKFYALGLNPNQLGIMLDDTLYSSKWHSPIDQLKHLSSLPSSINRVLLGEDYSQKAIEKFAKNSKLYFGYSVLSQTKDIFVELIARASQLTQKPSNLSIVLVGTPISLLTDGTLSSIPTQEVRVSRYLKRAGIHRIELYWKDPETDLLVKQGGVELQKAKKDETLQVASLFFFHSLPHDQLLSFLQASELLLSTGDQTISEALSAGPPGIYEPMKHKKEFINSLIEVAHNISSDLGRVVKTLFSAFNIDTMRLDENGVEVAFQERDIEQAASDLVQLRTPGSPLQQMWTRFITHLHTHYNCLRRINQLVAEQLSLSDV